MHLALSVAYAPWFSLDEQVSLARQADRLGFHSVWVAETWGQDAVAMLGLLAGVTERIGLAAGILQIPARQPTTTASAAATIDRASGGRMILGLGLSGPQVSEGWYGVPFVSPLGRTREYVEIVRLALSRRPVEYDGRHWTLPQREGGTGLGKPLALLGRAVQDRIPIYLGVSGERTVRQAGEIADGWLPFLFSPAHASMLTAPLLDGIAAAGRRREDVAVAPMVPVALADDVDTARELVRPILAFYFGAMGAREKNFYVEIADRYGFGAQARACQDAFLAGERREAHAALTADLVDSVAIAATPKTLEGKLSAYEEAGVDTLVVTPFGDRPALLDALATHLPPAQR